MSLSQAHPNGHASEDRELRRLLDETEDALVLSEVTASEVEHRIKRRT